MKEEGERRKLMIYVTIGQYDYFSAWTMAVPTEKSLFPVDDSLTCFALAMGPALQLDWMQCANNKPHWLTLTSCPLDSHCSHTVWVCKNLLSHQFRCTDISLFISSLSPLAHLSLWWAFCTACPGNRADVSLFFHNDTTVQTHMWSHVPPPSQKVKEREDFMENRAISGHPFRPLVKRIHEAKQTSNVTMPRELNR